MNRIFFWGETTLGTLLLKQPTKRKHSNRISKTSNNSFSTEVLLIFSPLIPLIHFSPCDRMYGNYHGNDSSSSIGSNFFWHSVNKVQLPRKMLGWLELGPKSHTRWLWYSFVQVSHLHFSIENSKVACASFLETLLQFRWCFLLAFSIHLFSFCS